MRGSRSLLIKKGLNQIMFIQQLVKTSKEIHVKENEFSGPSFKD